MARYSIALAALLASSLASAAEVTVNSNGDLQTRRSLFYQIPNFIEEATNRFLQAVGVTPSGHPICVDPGFNLTMDANTMKIMGTMLGYENVMRGLQQYQDEGITVGSTTALACEASDAAVSGAPVEDGKSGDVNFPYGNIKAIATGGERSVCNSTYGLKITGTPDGIGAYLADDTTVRVVVQSEGYGPLRIESYDWPVNDGACTFGGSHVQYVDYDRTKFASFMEADMPASDMVTGMGEMVEHVINLKGEKVGKRNGWNNTAVGAHYGNTNADGKYVMYKQPKESDWFFQSLCSAHLEQKHQWGNGIGLEDDMFITNEEWANFKLDEEFVGQSAHALDVKTKTMYALGVLTQGGFEKNVEINPQHPDYVMIAIAGYNGAFENSRVLPKTNIKPDHITAMRNELYNRTDGKNYTWTKNIVPFRVYVGVKGKLEDGSVAPPDDFLARNGLKYGKIYGFAIPMSNSTEYRDAFHKKASNGDKVEGKWIAQSWQWDGEVKNYQHDGGWEYQDAPPGTGVGSALEGYQWWTAAGPDKDGCKTEHHTPDPRIGKTAFIQSSTCGYFGHLYLKNVVGTLNAANGGLPSTFDGEYYVYQGEVDITGQIMLGGKGQHTEGRDATRNWDSSGMKKGGKVTFEDIDGFEIFEHEGKLHAIIQEDSGSKLGERAFITGPLEHEADGKNLTYYFIAFSGGDDNTRMAAGVGIPKGVACHDGEDYVSGAHEFSGAFDASSLVKKDASGNFIMKASDSGLVKRQQDRATAINDKSILMSLQTGKWSCGVIGAFATDRGGQWLMYRPKIPA